VRLCKALDCGRCGCLKPIRACCVVKSAFFLVAPPRGGFAMAPRDSGMCWKQFMMCLEEVWFVAMIHLRFFNLTPMHDPGRRRNSRPCDGPARARDASVPPFLLSCCCWRRRPPAARRSRLRAAPPPGACLPESPWCRPVVAARRACQWRRGGAVTSLCHPARSCARCAHSVNTVGSSFPFGA